MVEVGVVCVFVPATPNPTSGFLLMLPEDKMIKLQMSVAEGIKYVISLGAISPGTPPAAIPGFRTPPNAVSAAGHD